MSEIEKLKEIIKSSDNIVFFGGAGVSTESGIPDFRSESGIYRTKSKYGVSPETILSHSFFMAHPDMFYDFYKSTMIYPGGKPNAAHKALAALEKQGKVKAVVTQNIDGLHQMAGSKIVYELHGSVYRNHCNKCGAAFDLSFILKSTGIPRCETCGGIVKPDVTLYEEPLDENVMNRSLAAIESSEVLIVGGTSLSVYPAAGLVRYFRGNHLVLINKSSTPLDREAGLVIYDSIGKVLGQMIKAQ